GGFPAATCVSAARSSRSRSETAATRSVSCRFRSSSAARCSASARRSCARASSVSTRRPSTPTSYGEPGRFPAGKRQAALRGPLQALFCPCPADDVVPLAEPDARPLSTVRHPQFLELRVECLDLLDHCRITALGKRIPQGHASLAQLFDLIVDPRNGVHAFGERRHCLRHSPPRSFPNAGVRTGTARRPPLPRRARPTSRPRGTSSLVAQLGQAVLVQPEVVPELVEHRDPDLLTQLALVREVGLEGEPVDREPAREVAGVGPALGQRHPL